MLNVKGLAEKNTDLCTKIKFLKEVSSTNMQFIRIIVIIKENKECFETKTFSEEAFNI